MPLNRQTILQLAESNREFALGEELFRQRRTELRRTDSFWRGERMFRMAVKEGEEVYLSSISVRQGEPGKLTCSCRQPETRTKLCRHLVAAAFDVENREKLLAAPHVSTSEAMRELLGDYSNRAFSDEMAKHSQEPLRLVPVLHWKDGELQFSFSLAGGCAGRLHDLTEFARALEQGLPLKLGRQHNIPVMNMGMFAEEDRRLAETVKNIVLDEAESSDVRQRSRALRLAGDGFLLPDRSGLDELMDCLVGRTLETIPDGLPAGGLKFVDRNPRLSLLVEPAGKDGVALQVTSGFGCVQGRKHLYVCGENKIYRSDESYLNGAGRLLLAMEKNGRRKAVFLQERDLPGFYHFYQQEVKPAFRVELRDVDFEDYKPMEFTAEFYVDSPARNELTLQIKFKYGEETVSPFDYVMRPDIKRNMAGEKLIAGIVKQYFRARSPERDCFVIRDNEDEMFLFLRSGIRELTALGDLYLAERMKSMRLIPKPRVSLGVMAQGDWFNLQVDAEGMSQAELREALLRYRKRERYIRLESGDFLDLEEKGMKALAELYGDLETVTDDEGNEVLLVPAYRALYVDNLGEQMDVLGMTRSKEFSALIERLKKAPETAYRVPKSLDTVMKDYQKQGFYWMKNLDALGFGGILADEMGLGKTLQAISLMIYAAGEQENQASLIVCPASLVYNWKHELEQYAPELVSVSVVGDAEERAQILSEAQKYQVLITSYDLMKRDIDLYESIRFRYCFLDEAQYIKNHLTQNAKAVKQLQAQTRFALTGTPIENRLSELWSIMDFLMPGLLYNYSRFSRELEQPLVRDQSEDALERLHRLIGPFVLRRLKKDVLKELPDKLETVVYTKLEGEQKRLYAANALALRNRLTDTDDAQYRKDRMQVLAELTRLRQICCDPSLYYDSYEGGSAKLEACIELIMSSIRGGHKILLFSQFTSMLERIGNCLRDRDIHYYELTGQTGKKERVELTERFNEDDVPVFLISLKAGGTGLNLTAADVVIHYDPWWNVAAQNQATDRAHRLGQKNVVSVFKLITRSTIEENILLLQENKRQLAEKMMEGGGGLEHTIGRDELIALLEERRSEDEFY